MTEITNNIINQGQFIPHLKEGDFLPALLKYYNYVLINERTPDRG